MKKMLLLFFLFGFFNLNAQPKDPQKGMTKQEIDAYLKKMKTPAMQKKAESMATKQTFSQTKNSNTSSKQKNTTTISNTSSHYNNLTQALTTGVLPQPIIINHALSIQEQAKTIAKEIIQATPKAASAIVTAFLASGFTIQKQDGTKLLPFHNDVGITITEFEVVSTSKLLAQGYGINPNLLINALLKTTLKNNYEEVDGLQLMHEDLENAKQSENKSILFYANLFEELNNESTQDEEVTTVAYTRLNALQTMLFLYKLSTDVLAKKLEMATSFIHNSNWQNKYVVQISNHGPNINFFPDPCTDGFKESSIDAAKAAKSIVWGGITEKIKTAMGNAAEAFSKKVGDLFDKATDLLNFFHKYSLLKIIITGSTELKRSRTTEDGEQKDYNVSVSVDDNMNKFKNCASKMLEELGNKINENGGIEGVKVAYKLIVKGAYTELNDAFQEDFKYNLARSAAEDLFSTEECKTTYANITNTNFASCISLTNKEGKANITLKAKGLPVNLPEADRKPLYRAVGIIAYAQLTPTENREGFNELKDLWSIVGSPITSAAQGDAVGTAAKVSTETAQRLTWFPSEPFIITFRDWDYCKNSFQENDNREVCFIPRHNISITETMWGSIKDRLANTGLVDLNSQLGASCFKSSEGYTIMATGPHENVQSLYKSVAIKFNWAKPGVYKWNTPDTKNVEAGSEQDEHLAQQLKKLVVTVETYNSAGITDIYTQVNIKKRTVKQGDNEIIVNDYYGTQGSITIETNNGKIISGFYKGNMYKINPISGAATLVKVFGRFEANIVNR